MHDLLVKGELHLDAGSLEAAAQSFEQAVKVGGPNPASFAGLALIAMQTGDMETCESVLKTVQSMKVKERNVLYFCVI